MVTPTSNEPPLITWTSITVSRNDLVCGWTGERPESVGPRLALQLIHEAAMCRTGLRYHQTLNQRIFELVNGLPFLASEMAIHELLWARTVADSQRFQVALGKIRRASGYFRGWLLVVDPHRVRSFSRGCASA